MTAPKAGAPLTARQAASCENATSPRSSCKCRCGGEHHGARRGGVRDLPEGDLHRPDDEDPKVKRARERDKAVQTRFALLAGKDPPE